MSFPNAIMFSLVVISTSIFLNNNFHELTIHIDYGHGTGHGVGAALNVHEGPMSISPKFHIKEGLKRGMVVSNEPGYVFCNLRYDID